MAYLLDTNIISELFRKSPNHGVAQWVKSKVSDELYLSVLSLGEIRRGAELLQDLQKKQRIISWLEHDLVYWFENRLLTIDHFVADKWGFLSASTKRPLPTVDTLLAATALVHNLTFVTRNTKDFDHFSLELINPWHI